METKRLTRTEWLGYEDLGPMFPRVRGKATARQLRLFACACVRLVWHLLVDERSRQAVEVAEKFADGRASQDQVVSANRMAPGAYYWAFTPALNGAAQAATREAACAAYSCAHSFNADVSVIRVTANHASNALGWVEASKVPPWELQGPRWRIGKANAIREQCGLLRDIVNPFRLPSIDPGWLRWESGTVLRIARSLYDEGRFDELPILADALEDAGCEEQLIAHCREPGPHVRGCWALDLLLEKGTKLSRVGA